MASRIWIPLRGFAYAALAAALLTPSAGAQATAPGYEVDPSWPKPLPDRWILGGLAGVCVDSQDHVLILNRQNVVEGDLNAGSLAPLIIEFDPEGNVVHSWGDPDLLDLRLHGCFFDEDDNVWIASAPSGMVQKYSHDGELLFQIGTKGVFDSSDGTARGQPLNSDAARFMSPSDIYVDPVTGEIYVADGEGRGTNRRIAVMDREGRFLRQWEPEGMETVHCMTGSGDGLIYVCNRENARMQVYNQEGNFIRNIDIPWQPYTPPENGVAQQSGGSAVSVDLSPDSDESLLYVINQNSARIEIIDRETGRILSSFGGSAGQLPGQFNQHHGLAVDSERRVYVTENRGRRIQRFIVAR